MLEYFRHRLGSVQLLGALLLSVGNLVTPLVEPFAEAQNSEPTYVGSADCADCHSQESKEWAGSHHQRAMEHASSKTVLGDFNNATFTYAGITSRFYRKGDLFFVRTDGPDGKLRDYQIEFTFGVDPLQQYLIKFPGGRFQALSIAWDARPKADGGQRWFHLYPKEKVDHKDVLHWTKLGQNWNYMCAECHSTNVKKNYDPAKLKFDTTWSEVSVGCEACHGPASSHMEWAKRPEGAAAQPHAGFQHSLKLSKFVANHDASSGKTLPSSHSANAEEVDTCARCHSRRSLLSEDYAHGGPLLDTHLPALLSEGLYYPDGQINDEVYEYGSFLQSKMYQSGVTCSNCHNPHSGTLRAPGNATCAQCHQATKYDQPSHHFHKTGTSGAACTGCHMPSKNYMLVDTRHDHSFRIPQPALSKALGTPDACLSCHTDKTSEWSHDQLLKRHGPRPVVSGHFGLIFDAARKGKAEVVPQLMSLVDDRNKPEIVRATALAELQPFLNPQSIEAVKRGLSDKSDLVRSAAVRTLENAPPQIRVPLATPLLSDPVLAVRIEAALVLAPVSDDLLSPETNAALREAGNEYLNAQRVNAETPQAQVNLGLFFLAQGKNKEAEEAYRTAIRLERQFVPGYINLADLLRSLNRDEEGQQVLIEALKHQPKNAELHFALGLLYVRQGSKAKALDELRVAVELGPEQARIAYVFVVALQDAGKTAEAKKVLDEALAKHPDSVELQNLR